MSQPARKFATTLILLAVVAAILVPGSVFAQQPPPQPQPPAQPPPVQPSNEWEKLPRMQLERQFAGPLQDTIIQRWRDTVDGTICYVYLPITVQHSAPTQSGFVQYGANLIGSISCFAPPPTSPAPAARPPAPKK